jgi:hypothetical protein
MREIHLIVALTLAVTPVWGQEAAKEDAKEAGFGILNATSPAPGLLFGGQPTAEQLEALAAADYKTVIDLRAPEVIRGYDEGLRNETYVAPIDSYLDSKQKGD